jgi:hypothetical protein
MGRFSAVSMVALCSCTTIIWETVATIPYNNISTNVLCRTKSYGHGKNRFLLPIPTARPRSCMCKLVNLPKCRCRVNKPVFGPQFPRSIIQKKALVIELLRNALVVPVLGTEALDSFIDLCVMGFQEQSPENLR